MANAYHIKQSEVPLCAFIILLLTHCYSVFAILDRRVYVDEDIRKNYKIEDFLWSGSGDGEDETELTPTEKETTWEYTTTVFHTTTIISTSTVFYNLTTPSSTFNSNTRPSVKCLQHEDNCTISPTPTVRQFPSTAILPWPPPTENSTFADAIPDQRFWLVTILKVNMTDADLIELEEHLARLYKIAFHRHQERHLGLQAASSNAWNQARLRSLYTSRKRREYRDTVSVHIHNVTNDDAFNILYTVRVSGLPVLATTAAYDMKLVSDAEVGAELGYPVITKAEPYLKAELIRGDKPEREYLLVLVSSVCAVILIILFIFLFLLTVKKRKKSKNAKRQKNKQGGQFTGSGDDPDNMSGGIDNAAFTAESDPNKTLKVQGRPSSHHRKTKQSSAQTDTTSKDFQNHSRGLPSNRPTSPNSFLSMPSVRDFPTTPLPEPLTNLLNSGSPPPSNYDKTEQTRSKLSRHGSISGEDPGVVGPMVWHMHRHQLEKADDAMCVNDCSSPDSDIDVGQMRKRFNQLLDDALSMYDDSRRSSNDYIDIDRLKNKHTAAGSLSCSDSQLRTIQRRSQSAMTAASDTIDKSTDDGLRRHTRPQTSLVETRKPISLPKVVAPDVRGAWYSGAGTPSTSARLHSRPLSAGPFHRPVVHPEFIFTDSQLSPNDPVVPIISAIKRELDKIPEYKKYEARDPKSGGSDFKTRPSSSTSASYHMDTEYRK